MLKRQKCFEDEVATSRLSTEIFKKSARVVTKKDKKSFDEIRKYLTWASWISTEATDVNCKIRKKSGGINK